MVDLYNQIFRRKSFHKFKNTIPLTNQDLKIVNDAIKNAKPLDENIKIKVDIVKESQTSCKLGAELCLLFYSEETNFYLENIGYIGEQIDLYLTSNNIGTLWCGLGKTKTDSLDGLKYVIMICIAKVSKNDFRTDLNSFKRKPLKETWEGDLLPFSNSVILAPSAVNSQPWYIVNQNNELFVYRNNKAAKFGFIPLKIMKYYNQIDMGIYLYFLDLCFTFNGFDFSKELIFSNPKNTNKTLICKYSYKKKV